MREPRYKGVAVRVRGYAEGVLCWAELESSDPGGAATFYRELFGWRYDPDGVFRRDGLAVAGLRAGTAGWLAYLAGDDLGGLVDQAVDSGGEILRQPVEVPGRGRSALLADTSGAAFGIWQRTGFPGAQLGSEPGTVCFGELATPDVGAAGAFYGKVFGWTAQPGDMVPGSEYYDWLLGEWIVGGMIESAAGTTAHWRITIEVAELSDTLLRCRDLGGRVEIEPFDVAVGRYARIVDPYGAGFGVIELIPELRDLAS
jgi:predicted enzyme related to lactoylglutathione lyase